MKFLSAIVLLLVCLTACERKPQDSPVDISQLRGELIVPRYTMDSNNTTSVSVPTNSSNISNNLLPSPPLVWDTNMSTPTAGSRSRLRDKPGSYPKRMMELRARFSRQGGDVLTNLVGLIDPPWRTNLSTPPVPGFLSISFSQLAGFEFPDQPEAFKMVPNGVQAREFTLNHIPEAIRALDGHRCAIRGFLLPLVMDEGLAIEFLLMRDQTACCYGMVPRINEWIIVRVKGRGVKPQMDVPLTVCGTFRVGDFREQGSLIGLYQMEAEKVIAP